VPVVELAQPHCSTIHRPAILSMSTAPPMKLSDNIQLELTKEEAHTLLSFLESNTHWGEITFPGSTQEQSETLIKLRYLLSQSLK
jgi:hypothetical protein